MQNQIGVMQGRLLPRVEGKYQFFPRNWPAEFEIAEAFGFKYLEFIFGPKLEVEKIHYISSKNKVKIKSVCADYFMDNPIFMGIENKIEIKETMLAELIRDCYALKIEHVTIPCVDNSSLKTEEDIKNLKKILKSVLLFALLCDIYINLETDLPPQKVAKLLTEINHPNLKINYDMGNSASLGYDPDEEFSLYGDRMGVVHIKDRTLNGPSVKLGTGNVDFEKVFHNLEKIEFDGPLVMQAYREENYLDDLDTLMDQLEFVKKLIK